MTFLICPNLRLGTRWNGTNLEHTREAEKEDAEAGRDPEGVSLQVFIDAANSVIPYLTFTGEVSRGRSNKIPCLDTEVWYGRPDRQERWFEGTERNGEKIPGTQWEDGRRKVQIMTASECFYALRGENGHKWGQGSVR